MCGAIWMNDPTGHDNPGHDQRNLCHTNRPPERSQVHDLDGPLVLRPHQPAATRTTWPLPAGLGVYPYRASGPSTVTLPRPTRSSHTPVGSTITWALPDPTGLDAVRSAGPPYRARDALAPDHLPSHPKGTATSRDPGRAPLIAWASKVCGRGEWSMEVLALEGGKRALQSRRQGSTADPYTAHCCRRSSLTATISGSSPTEASRTRAIIGARDAGSLRRLPAEAAALMRPLWRWNDVGTIKGGQFK